MAGETCWHARGPCDTLVTWASHGHPIACPGTRTYARASVPAYCSSAACLPLATCLLDSKKFLGPFCPNFSRFLTPHIYTKIPIFQTKIIFSNTHVLFQNKITSMVLGLHKPLPTIKLHHMKHIQQIGFPEELTLPLDAVRLTFPFRHSPLH